MATQVQYGLKGKTLGVAEGFATLLSEARKFGIGKSEMKAKG
jgi:hypothetical protein